MARLKILKARAGRMVRGRFVPGTRKNVAEGFYDKSGVFHPIRASSDYDPSRGDAERKTRKKKPKAKSKAKPKAKKRPAKKRAAAKKRRR